MDGVCQTPLISPNIINVPPSVETQQHLIAPQIPREKPECERTPVAKRHCFSSDGPVVSTCEEYESQARINIAAFLRDNTEQQQGKQENNLNIPDELQEKILKLEGGRTLLGMCEQAYQLVHDTTMDAKEANKFSEILIDRFEWVMKSYSKKGPEIVALKLCNTFRTTLPSCSFSQKNDLSSVGRSIGNLPSVVQIKVCCLLLNLISKGKNISGISPKIVAEDVILAGDALLDLKPEACDAWLDGHKRLYTLVHEKLVGRGIGQSAAKSICHFFWSSFPGGKLSADNFSLIERELAQYAWLEIAKPVLSTMFQNPLGSQLSEAGLDESSMPPLDVNELTYGEEFEFYLKNDGLGVEEEFKDILKQWTALTEEVLKKKQITDYEIMLFDPPEESELQLRVGHWHGKIFLDGIDVLEVNTSPYYLNGRLTPQQENSGQEKSGSIEDVYQLFDLIIFGVVEKIGLKPRSGHKHVDISRALHGNAEVLFRLLVDVEARAWLPRLQGREARSKDVFLYLKQEPASMSRTMSFLVEQFNRQLVIAPERRKKACYDDTVRLKEALKDLGLLNKNKPLNLLHLKPTELAAPGSDVSVPSTTIEFRFPQAARSGEEAKAMNKMLCAWLQLMERDQRDNKPLRDYFNDPMAYNNDQEVIALFRGFARELGIDWEQARQLSHIDDGLQAAPGVL